MQTSIATACLSGSLGDNQRSAAEADPDDKKLFENDVPSFEGEPEELLEEHAATLGPAFVAASVSWLPRALRF